MNIRINVLPGFRVDGLRYSFRVGDFITSLLPIIKLRRLYIFAAGCEGNHFDFLYGRTSDDAVLNKLHIADEM